MARITLIDEDKRPDLAPVIGKLKGNRGGKLINVYRLLLNAPAIANAWEDFNSTVRGAFSGDLRVCELVIIRVAILNRTEYIFRVHVPRLSDKAGLSTAEVEQIYDWRASKSFSPRERAALAYTDALTRDVEVPDAVFAETAAHFSEQQLVELTVLIGAYNMHSRVMRGLRNDIEPGTEGPAAPWRPAG